MNILTKNKLMLTLKMLFVCLIAVSSYYLLKETPPEHHNLKHWDKLEHIALFFVLTTLAISLFKQYIWQVVMLLMVYGALSEYFQASITKTRKGSVSDWLADFAGILLAGVAFWCVNKLIAKRKQA